MPNPRESVSPKQLAANRANAAKSTGLRAKCPQTCQTNAECHYRRAVEEFDRLKVLRQELPTKAISTPNQNKVNHLNNMKAKPSPFRNRSRRGFRRAGVEVGLDAARVGACATKNPAIASGVLGSMHLSGTTCHRSLIIEVQEEP